MPFRPWLLNLTSAQSIDTLVFCQGYVPNKCCKNRTQNFHLQQCISWGVRGMTPSPYRLYDYTTTTTTCRVYMYCTYSIFLYSIHIFILLIILNELHKTSCEIWTTGAVCPDTSWNKEERNTGEKCSTYKMNYCKQVNSNLSMAWNSVHQILTSCCILVQTMPTDLLLWKWKD